MKRWIAITMLALLLVGCGFAGIDAGIQLFKTQAELAQTQIELTDTQAELETA